MAAWALVGLGNPGASYAGHRHNAGFLAVDTIAKAYDAASWSSKFSSHLSQCSIDGQTCRLLKPQTFMNRSGQAVAELSRYYDIPPERVVVFHDELDLPPARLRIKQGGGHGGHNGLKDIDAHLGKEYWRVRLGIGHPGHKDAVHGYVLHDFGKDERAQMQALLDALAAEWPLFFAQGHEALMSRVAYRLKE